ncbi:zf-HC2 domain-containing protein [Frankia sp. Cr1]|uniref:anti-sigma factor family protein n=1 Tax=Frankia sp. Cr1 TaxID=3073931 RepID=UPI002AD48E8E|nr:zf-HC2 domain-containing protein [Frankia sp. Cr1]
MTGHLGKQIAPLVDGQLDHDGRDRALAHVACCSSCQWEVAELRHLKARLAGLGDPTLPGGVADRLLRMAAPADSGPARTRPVSLAIRGVIRTAGRGLFIGVIGVISSVDQPVVPSPARSADPPQSAMPTGATAGRVASSTRPVDLVGATGPTGRRRPGSKRRLDSSRPAAARPAGTASGGRRPATSSASGWRGRQSRTRRTLVSSVAVMLFAVAGAALGEIRAPGTVAQPPRPVAVPAAQPNVVSRTGIAGMSISRTGIAGTAVPGTNLSGTNAAGISAAEVDVAEAGAGHLPSVMAAVLLPDGSRR